jgi:hypothetical protein
MIPFAELMQALGITDKANFNRTIRKHHAFRQALERMGLVEVAINGASLPNALRRLFGPVAGATYVGDVQGSHP